MKTKLLFLMFLSWCGVLTAQNIVINDSILGGITIPFQDTIVSSFDNENAYCITTNYFIDLDQDAIHDTKFHLECYMGGQGRYDKMMLSTFNDFEFHVDTGYQEHYQYVNDVGEVCDTISTRTVVKRYNSADTIDVNEIAASEQHYLLNYSVGNDPLCIYGNIDLFNGDTSYIAFTKGDGDLKSLYYIQIFVGNGKNLHLMWAKKSRDAIGIAENELSSAFIFPNPVAEELHFRAGYEYVEIYTLHGLPVVRERLSNNQNALKVSTLQKGVYLIKFMTDKTELTTKFIKL